MTTKSIEWSIQNSGTFASVVVKLPNETGIHCESDAIVTMSGNLQLHGEMRGGFFAALARFFLTQETFFATAVKAKDGDGDIMLAANEPGDIMLHRLTPSEDLLLTRGSYVAADTSVNITTKVQTGFGNAKMSGTGLFLIRAYGNGTIACSAFGAIHKFVLAENEHRLVDNGHLIGWSANMKYHIGKATSSLVGTLTSGEGIMLHFTGPGTLYVQSHTPKVEVMPQAASARKRKGMKSLQIIFQILVIVIIVLLSTLRMLPVMKNSKREDLYEGEL